MAELFDPLPAAPVLRTFVQFLIAFCSRPELDSDIISGVCVEWFDAPVKLAILGHTVLEI